MIFFYVQVNRLVLTFLYGVLNDLYILVFSPLSFKKLIYTLENVVHNDRNQSIKILF